MLQIKFPYLIKHIKKESLSLRKPNLRIYLLLRYLLISLTVSHPPQEPYAIILKKMSVQIIMLPIISVRNQPHED